MRATGTYPQPLLEHASQGVCGGTLLCGEPAVQAVSPSCPVRCSTARAESLTTCSPSLIQGSFLRGPCAGFPLYTKLNGSLARVMCAASLRPNGVNVGRPQAAGNVCSSIIESADNASASEFPGDAAKRPGRRRHEAGDYAPYCIAVSAGCLGALPQVTCGSPLMSAILQRHAEKKLGWRRPDRSGVPSVPGWRGHHSQLGR